jgi:hypothetical protein
MKIFLIDGMKCGGDNVINPDPNANIRRLFAIDLYTALEQDEFFKTLEKAESDPSLLRSIAEVYFHLRVF